MVLLPDGIRIPAQGENGSPGCYTLDLYCRYEADHHTWQEFPHQYLGETYSQCASQARKRGWTLDKGGQYHTCPKCTKAIKAHYRSLK